MNDGEDHNAEGRFLIEDHMRSMLVPLRATRDPLGLAAKAGIIGEELEDMLEVGGIGLRLKLAELVASIDEYAEEIVSGPLRQAIAI